MNIFDKMGTDTKIVGCAFLASTAAYFIARHFDKKATEQALEESPQSQQVQQGGAAVEPVNP